MPEQKDPQDSLCSCRAGWESAVGGFLPPSPSPPSLQVECKAIMVFFHYCVVSNYFWLFIEGLYLFTLLVETFFPERRYFYWYIIIGWGRSLTVASAQATWLRPHGQICPWSAADGISGSWTLSCSSCPLKAHCLKDMVCTGVLLRSEIDKVLRDTWTCRGRGVRNS